MSYNIRTLRFSFLLLILFPFHGLLASPIDSCYLQSLDDWNKFGIARLGLVKSDYILAIDNNNEIHTWNGKTWSKFKPALPNHSIRISFFKAFSSTCVWAFYIPQKYIYHTDCYHFNGQRWIHLKLPQPTLLDSFAFLDSTRFFAAGAWGSLIYYDGKTARNIRIIPYFHISLFKAFSEKSFLAELAFDDNSLSKIHYLYRYTDGKWVKLKQLNSSPNFIHFFNADSGWLQLQDGSVLSYANDTLRMVDSPFVHQFIRAAESDTIFYFEKDGYLYKQVDKNIQALTPFASLASMYILKEDELILSNFGGEWFYYGRRILGKPIETRRRPQFIKYTLVSSSSTGYTGLSVYDTKNRAKEIYFTGPTSINMFLSFPPNIVDLSQYKDVFIKRGLIGYSTDTDAHRHWDSGVFFGDLDNDGDEDAILATLRGGCRLFENNGHDQFLDVTELYNFKVSGRVALIQFVDVNHDGLLDFFVGDEVGPLKIFINRRFWRFEEIANKTGLPDSLNRGTPALADVDNDGDADLFIYGNSQRLLYFENQQAQGSSPFPQFVDQSNRSPELTTRFDFFTQSISFNDFDLDGDLDLLLVNRVSPTKLFVNDGAGCFSDASQAKGFNQQFLAYGSNWGDLNQDGYDDVFLTTLGKRYIYWNQRGAYFQLDSISIPQNDLAYSTGSLLEDLDGDGDLDIVVANQNIGLSCVYENNFNLNNYIKLDLKCEQSNYFGVGAEVKIYASDLSSSVLKGYKQVILNTGYCSSQSPQLYFGLPAKEMYQAQISFPSGKSLTVDSLRSGKTYTFIEPVTASADFKIILNFFLTLILHKKYQHIFLQCLLALCFFFIINKILFRRVIWQPIHYVFFNSVLLVVFSVGLFYINPLQPIYLLFIPLYALILSAGIIYLIFNRYVTLELITEKQFQLFDLMRQFHHSHTGMNSIDHLIFYCNNYSRAVSDAALKSECIKAFSDFYDNTLPLLRRIASLEQRLFNAAESNKSWRKALRFTAKISRKIIVDSVPEKTCLEVTRQLQLLKKIILSTKGKTETLYSADLIQAISNAISRGRLFDEVSIKNLSGLDKIIVIIRQEDLGQALDNVLQNALDAMSDSSSKKIDISLQKTTGNNIAIMIRDYGDGIPPEIQNQIFKAHISGRNSSGLGLYHAKSLLEPFGGSISLLKSKPQHGSTFQLNLRIANHDQA